jgi:hypothetical protein
MGMPLPSLGLGRLSLPSELFPSLPPDTLFNRDDTASPLRQTALGGFDLTHGLIIAHLQEAFSLVVDW